MKDGESTFTAGLFEVCEARPDEYSCIRTCICTEINGYLIIYLIYISLSIYPVDMHA